jgi:amino acid transporter
VLSKFVLTNLDLYISSRTLYGLAVEGDAPRIFARTNARGVPIYALGASTLLCLLAFMNVSTASSVVFTYFVNLVTIFGLLTWISILVTHIYFIHARKAQGIPDTALAYVAPFGKWGSFGALFFCILISIFKGFNYFTHSPSYGAFDYKDFITAYLGIPLFLIMIFGFKLIMKSSGVRPEAADLYSGKAKIDREEEEYVEKQREKHHGLNESKWERYYRRTIGTVF